jgi:hypothetical protein
MSTSSKLIKTEPLTADNYLYWRGLQVTLLKALELFDHVESPLGIPVVPPADPAALLEWRKKDDLALAQLKINISKTEAYNTGDRDVPKTAYEVWQALQRVYTNTSMSSKMALQNRLQTYTLISATSIQDHSNGLRDLADQLKACGENIPEANLPPVFQHSAESHR